MQARRKKPSLDGEPTRARGESAEAEEAAVACGRELAGVVMKAVAERAPYCTAAIWYGEPNVSEQIGTATLMQHEGRLYFLTCAHVAQEFFASAAARILLGDRADLQIIDRTVTRWVRRSSRRDLALIEVDAHAVAKYFKPKSLEEFDLDRDLSDVSMRSAGLIVVGFPATMARIEDGRRRLTALAYGTVPHPAKRSTRHQLYLEYRPSPEVDPLPSPKGLSGSAVLTIDRAARDDTVPWGFPKIVAVQHAAVKSNYLRATGLSILRSWFRVHPG